MRTARAAPALRPLAAALGGLLAVACVHIPTAKEKDAAEIQHDLGVDAMRKGNSVEALREFQEAVKLWPEFPEAHYALGLLYHWSFRRLAEAEGEFRAALELRPGYSEAWNDLGALLAEKGDPAGARAAFEKALSDPLYATPWIAQTNLAWLRFEQGAREEGMQLVKAALTSHPDYCMGHRQLARMHEALGRADDAQASWDKFTRFCPDEPEALLRIGASRLREGDAREARRALVRCMEVAHERPPADECRALLARVPAVPDEPVAPAPEPSRDDAGRSVKGARDLDSTR
jgi:Tfp pilus assembly protein PilF